MLEGRKPKNSLLAEQTKTLPPLEMGNRDKFDEGIEQKVNFFGLWPSKIIKIFACGAKNENLLLHGLPKFSKFSPAALKSTGQLTEIFISVRNREFKFSKILKNFQNSIFVGMSVGSEFRSLPSDFRISDGHKQGSFCCIQLLQHYLTITQI